MPGPAGQELKDRRRRSAAFLLGSVKEAVGAPNGAAGAAAERSGNQPHAIPAETKILFGPVERPERRESKNKAIPLKTLNA